MIMSLKQNKIKFKPRIKLNHNIIIDNTINIFLLICVYYVQFAKQLYKKYSLDVSSFIVIVKKQIQQYFLNSVSMLVLQGIQYLVIFYSLLP